MIGWLSGRLIHRGEGQALIDVGGVGYVVHCAERTLAGLPQPGGAVALHTELVVREDLLQLYGFASLSEKAWFGLLTGVQGVGARAAVAVLGTLGADGVGRAVALGDAAAIRAAPGVGPKIAQRIVLELRGKAPAQAAGGAADTAGITGLSGPVPAAPLPPPAEGAAAVSDALSALANLGFAPQDAAAAVARAAEAGPDAGADALIRAALRHLAPEG